VQQVTAATTDTNGVDISAVLAVTPEGYPGNDGPLSQAKSSLGAAGALRAQIKADLQAIKTDLKGGTVTPGARHSAKGSTTTT
jgi:hypothetical protein